MVANIFTKIGEALLGEFKTTLIDRLSRVETKIDRIENDVGEIKADVRSLRGRTARLETVTTEIQSVLRQAGAQLHQPLLISADSPLKLTESGEELAKEIDAYRFISENKEFLFALLAKENPKTQYDVQEMAKKVLIDSIPRPVLTPIKKYAYENGLNIEVLLNLIGIILRDEYLAAHPEITS